jgi:hypothetical protein
MPKISTQDKLRRFKKINTLMRKYYTVKSGRTLPEARQMIAKELGICEETVRNAIKYAEKEVKNANA